MIFRLRIIKQAITEKFRLWCLITFILPLVYYLVLLVSLIVRFKELPNYLNVYTWSSNIILIWKSTPSLRDTLMIMREEWLMEIGYMNYDFGKGISEWSLVFIPWKILLVLFMCALIATQIVLMSNSGKRCSLAIKNSSRTCSGLGAAFVALSSVSMSWVVCCSTPTWVVGLSILGLGASTAFWLEPAGSWLQFIGFVALLAGCYLAAGPLVNVNSNELIAERI